MERREKLVDIERKSNPHTKGEVLIKKGREENWTQIVHKEQNYGKSNPYTENEVLIKKGG